MMRRGFLGAILAAGVAPAIAGSGILMPVRQIITPPAPTIVPPEASWTINAANSGLRLGDRITIAGIAGVFEVSTIATNSTVVTLQPWH